LRLTLSRRLQPDPTAPALIFIMLNPSSADETVDDPTIRRCIGFGRREAAGSIHVVNLFVQRASRPRTLWQALAAGEPAEVGRLALDRIKMALIKARPQDRIICAWGSAGTAPALVRPARLARIEAVLASAQQHRRDLHCLGRTADGSPRHPLYVRADQTLEAFDL
jgi:hypothetical protein